MINNWHDQFKTFVIQNRAFKPVFKMGFFYFILIASLKRRIFQFLWRSIILVFICTKFMRDVLRYCMSSAILSQNSVGVILVILNICWTLLHSLSWMLTKLIWHFKHVKHLFGITFSQFSHPRHTNSYTTNNWFIAGVLSLMVQKKSILVTSYKTQNLIDCSFFAIWFDFTNAEFN